MVHTRIATLYSLSTFLCLLVNNACALRGVDPASIHLYANLGAKKHFTCLDGSATIPVGNINDDYCDCLDGSDEPGIWGGYTTSVWFR